MYVQNIEKNNDKNEKKNLDNSLGRKIQTAAALCAL
jgi:hypothetical protein